jgi:RNA polymerase sigma factor (sigma-70 family)
MKDASDASVATTSPDRARVQLLYHFCRLQLPAVIVVPEVAEQHVRHCFQLYARKAGAAAAWDYFLDNLYPLDWFLATACLEGDSKAWEYLATSRAGRSDATLADALRKRAARLYPRNEERQESAVNEFWGDLYAPPDRPNALPILARYDGLRPLVPWLIRVFQNYHISELRKSAHVQPFPDDDVIPDLPAAQTDRWHDIFCQAAHDWLETLPSKELLILGLRLRYQLSQREVAGILGLHEGTLSRQTDKLSEQWKSTVSEKMLEQGWTGEDLSEYVHTEMRNLLLDDPRLSVDHLAHLLSAQGKSLPST